MKVLVFKCSFSKAEQVFPRHYTSNIATCSYVGEEELEDLKQIIPRDLFEKLVDEGEALIYDVEIVKKLLGEGFNENLYVRLMVKRE